MANVSIDDAHIVSHTHSPLPHTNLSPPIHFPLPRYPLPPLHPPPSVCEAFTSSSFTFASHHTDTPFYILPLALALSAIIKRSGHSPTYQPYRR